MKTKTILTIVLAVIFCLAGFEGLEAKKKKDRCDLIVKSLSAPSSADAGSKIRIISRVKNKGKSKAKKSYTKVYLSKNKTIGKSDYYLGKVKVSALKKKKTSKKYKTYVTIPSSIPGGRYYLIAKADGYKKIKEKSETNNHRKRRINIGNPTVTIDVASYANFNSRWDYQWTENGIVDTWSVAVSGIGLKNGKSVYILQEYDESGFPNDQDFYLTDMSQGLYRVGGIDNYQQPSEEEWFLEPPMPVLPSTFIAGKEYTYAHIEASMGSGTWTVKVDAASVIVPAGNYSDCYKSTVTRKYGTIQGSKTSWYCKNIGLVKRVSLDPSGSTSTWELTLYTPGAGGAYYYEIYGAQAGDYSMTKTGHQLIGTSKSGNTFDMSGYSRFILYVPPSSSKILFDAIGLSTGWVNSQHGLEYAHHGSNMNPTGSTWAQGDSYIEGPPDGLTIENNAGSHAYYSFTMNGATTLTIYVKQ